jgi:phenylalanine-4-hydroxylase
MKPDVKKLWYNKDTVNYTYDITKPQPQLFVTPTFQNVIDVLEEFADGMAFRRGGIYGLQKAVESRNTCTAVYSSGLQVSGVIAEFREYNGQPSFMKLNGPVTLSYDNRVLKGHGKDYHSDGFSSPVGKLKEISTPLEDMPVDDLPMIGIEKGKRCELNLESGITVKGVVKDVLTLGNKILVISFAECTVTDENGMVLFDPSWGVYDMAVGERITSVFCGAADKDAFEEIALKSNTGTHHVQYDGRTLELHQLYQQVRDRRQKRGDFGFLGNVWMMLQRNHHDDWLCALEILEILEHENAEPELAAEIRAFLEEKANNEQGLTKLINDGFYLIKHPVEQKLVV